MKDVLQDSWNFQGCKIGSENFQMQRTCGLVHKGSYILKSISFSLEWIGYCEHAGLSVSDRRVMFWKFKNVVCMIAS